MDGAISIFVVKHLQQGINHSIDVSQSHECRSVYSTVRRVKGSRSRRRPENVRPPSTQASTSPLINCRRLRRTTLGEIRGVSGGIYVFLAQSFGVEFCLKKRNFCRDNHTSAKCGSYSQRDCNSTWQQQNLVPLRAKRGHPSFSSSTLEFFMASRYNSGGFPRGN